MLARDAPSEERGYQGRPETPAARSASAHEYHVVSRPGFEKQMAVEVSLQDVHDREYHFVSQPGFEKQMEDIRMGIFGLR